MALPQRPCNRGWHNFDSQSAVSTRTVEAMKGATINIDAEPPAHPTEVGTESVSASHLPGALPVTHAIAVYRPDGSLDSQLTFGLYAVAPGEEA